MRGFRVSDGDVVITDHEIEYTEGNDLLSQTISSVLSTNRGEWLFDEEEGIEFNNIIATKEIDEDVIKSEIEQGISQVDDNINIDSFSCEFDRKTRQLNVHFTAKAQSGETITTDISY